MYACGLTLELSGGGAVRLNDLLGTAALSKQAVGTKKANGTPDPDDYTQYYDCT
jgi:hypothetical protein